jgi:hypothetical protein
MKPALKWLAGILLLPILLLMGPAIMALSDQVSLGGSWRHADRSSAGLAPDPLMTPEAVVQVYAARAFDWRGVFAVHTWIALKPAGADHYTVHHVTRWSGLRSGPGIPDGHWFGNPPHVLAELRGEQAEQAIARIEALIPDYPWAHQYRAWPGPNSNTFTAWITRQVPELRARLPSIAMGKDYMDSRLMDVAPSGRGVQVSLHGLLGILLAPEEGFEVNLLGLVTGFDTRPPGIKLPGVGHLHFGAPGMASARKDG